MTRRFSSISMLYDAESRANESERGHSTADFIVYQVGLHPLLAHDLPSETVAKGSTGLSCQLLQVYI